MTEPKKHDWKLMIAQIEVAGISHYKLATMMDAQLNQVDRWAEGIGRGPLHFDGELIIAIHAEFVSHETI